MGQRRALALGIIRKERWEMFRRRLDIGVRPDSLSWREILPWLFLLLLGIAFRFPEVAYVRHSYDQSYQMYDALRLLDGGRWPLIGQPSSVFLDNPPLMPYLQVLPLLVWRSPWSVYIFITLLNTLAIWFLYRAGKTLGDKKAGFVAALLFTINPWVIHFSRFPWTQALLPFFLSVVAWGLWPAMVMGVRDERRFLIGLLALTAMVQSYILAFVVLLPVGFLFFHFYRRLPRRALFVGAVVFLAGLLLFAAGLRSELRRNQRKFESFLEVEEYRPDLETMEHALRLVNGLDYNGQDHFGNTEIAPSLPMRVVVYGLGLALVAGLARAVWSLRSPGRRQRLATVLLVWFILPVVTLAFLPYPIHPHYLLLTLPAGHFLAAWALLPLLESSRARPVLILALVLVATQFRLNLYEAGQAIRARPGADGLGALPLVEAARVGDAVRALTAGVPAPRRVYADEDVAILSGMSATLLENNRDLSYPDFVLLPGQELFLYILLNQEPAAATLGPSYETFPDKERVLLDGTRVSFVRVHPYTREQALALPGKLVDWPSDAGLTLLGYDLNSGPALAAGQSFRVTTYWRVQELHPARAEWYIAPFFHVRNSERQIMVNIGGHGVWGYRWRLGDIYIQRVTIPLPETLQPGEYHLAMGISDPIDPTRRFNLLSPEASVPTFEVAIQIH